MMAFSERLRKFINTNALRTQFSDNARAVIRTRIEDNPEVYRLAYRDTIEQVLFNIDIPEPVKTPETTQAAVTEEVAKPAAVVVDGIEMKVPEDMKK
jgi:hypothetical protein